MLPPLPSHFSSLVSLFIIFYSFTFLPSISYIPLSALKFRSLQRVYLEGAAHPIEVFSDHRNLKYFSQARTTSRRHARWAATLAAYDYVIVYRKGANNGKPDALSRRPDYLLPPLPSLPILPPPPLVHTPTLVGAAVLVSPDDPLLPAVAAAEGKDVAPSAIIRELAI